MPQADGHIPLPPDDGPLGARGWLALALGAAALTVLTYVTEPSVFTSIDWLRIHVFYKEYLAAAIGQGRLPFWNPHIALGRPFLADVDSVVFYPPSAAYVFLEVHLACVLGIGLHLFLGLYGTRKLARAMGIVPVASWAAAFVFVTSAPIVGAFSSGLINYGAALCYIPLVFYLLLRLQAGRSVRLVAVLALVLGFQIFAGHPQATWLTCLGAGLLLVGRRLDRPLVPALKALALDLAALGAAILAASAMAAVVLLPLGELAGQSNRHAPSLSFAGSFAMTALGWLTLASPNDPHSPVMANAQLYAGIVVFLAAPCTFLRWRQPNARALVLILLCAGLLAAGNATPIFRVFYYLIPGLSQFRVPSRATVLMTLALVLAAGMFFSTDQPRRFPFVLAAAALAALGMVWASADAVARYGGPAHLSCARWLAGWQGILVLLATGLMVLWWQRNRLPSPRAPAIVASLLALLSLADIAMAAARLRKENREVPADMVEARLAKVLHDKGLFTKEGAPPRIAVPQLVLENSGMRHGWSTFTGYTSMMLGRVWEYIHAGIGLEVPTEQVAYPDGKILMGGPFAYDSMGLQVGAEPGTNRLVLPNSPDARAYLAPAALRVRDHREATRRMHDGHPFHRVALVEQTLPPHIPTTEPEEGFAGKAEITRFEPERISVRVNSPRAAILVLAEPWFPHWEAQVDGRPAECFPANAWMRAVLVPAGNSDVVFTYRSTYFALGAGISLATFALLLLLVLRPARGNSPALNESQPG
jgi:hypothetical protein